MAEPDIYGYLDFRAFLRDWFASRKARDPRFSRRQFVRLAGKRSPGLLTDVMDGARQLSPPMVRAFAQAMELTAPQAAFFDALVRLDQAADTKERNEAWRRVSGSKAFREARPLEGASMEYLSCWWFPVVRELAHRPDFVADPAWIAERVRPQITVAQASKALQTLQTLGLLVVTEDGGLAPAEGVVTTPHEVQALGVVNYHRNMLRLAVDAIDAFPGRIRHLVAATVSVPEASLPEIKQALNEVQERILDLSDRFEGDAERVVQVHLVMFPLSDSAVEES
ncbi:MAG: TIGR02147 family protein [Myxococcales bacterium]|nr:TIGR02147 family protein [Myxococcales bacterium]